MSLAGFYTPQTERRFDSIAVADPVSGSQLWAAEWDQVRANRLSDSPDRMINDVLEGKGLLSAQRQHRADHWYDDRYSDREHAYREFQKANPDAPAWEDVLAEAHELQRVTAEEHEKAQMHYAGGWSGVIGFGAGVGAAMTDPINIATLPFGGGTTIPQIMGRAAAVSLVAEAPIQASIIQHQMASGQQYTTNEFISTLIGSAVGGALLGGALPISGRALDAIDSRLLNASDTYRLLRGMMDFGDSINPAAKATMEAGVVSKGVDVQAPPKAATPEFRGILQRIIDAQNGVDGVTMPSRAEMVSSHMNADRSSARAAAVS